MAIGTLERFDQRGVGQEIADHMDPRAHRIGIDHTVSRAVVQGPQFAWTHPVALTRTVHPDCVAGDDGGVDAYGLGEIVGSIDMRGDYRPGGQQGEQATKWLTRNVGINQLAQVGQVIQSFAILHRQITFRGCVTAQKYRFSRVVDADATASLAPHVLWQLFNFGAQPRRIANEIELCAASDQCGFIQDGFVGKRQHGA
ncbi:MAG: hypothetical protein WBV61_10880 [Rhodanobacteraceae bacterium]